MNKDYINIIFISTGVGFNTNGVTCLDWIESSKIESLPPEYIKNNHEVIRLNQLYLKLLKSPLNQSGSKIINDSNKLQSSSANNRIGYTQNTANLTKFNADDTILIGTPDILQSSEVHCISSFDTAEGTLLQPIPYPQLPSAVTPIYKEMM